ncbi:hypothetical protein SAMN05444171_2473 [Bradyrhizobium lablabi]|jgi:hypothetical protein|uniref:Integrase n=2 Tax=Bradyrhizobium TaxID=374 RepID=A0ABY0PZN7_9BRAD|nr:hypothetical protein SAMN05444163_4689 [Bradyrhizobium ottawaense]SEC87476.1 hypothetical protein SAMN05444171_2473 [Bradyrhizobium lablabi]SHK96527.1 hypothetical protein SAMN05444321_1297 [Bradyrhizobium lablabi]
MRDAAVQRGDTMIPIGASQQPPEPHVSHAESGPLCDQRIPKRDDEDTRCQSVFE